MNRTSIGPFDAALPGAFQLALDLDGGEVFRSEVRLGYSSRGIERLFEEKEWGQGIPLAGRVDAECGFFGEWVYALAVEALVGINIPPRAAAIRIAIAELTRISSHLKCLAVMAREAECTPVFHYCLRNRERFLDLFEHLAGVRFNLNYCRIGGVARDLTDGVIERAVQECESIIARVREINDLMSYQRAFLDRVKGGGLLGRTDCLAYGVTGPVARASGVISDLRADSGDRLGYADLEFTPMLGGTDHADDSVGDTHDRFLIRVREILQSAELVRSVLSRLVPGEVWDPRGRGRLSVSRGEGIAFVEGPRGMLGCFVASEGKLSPTRVQFRSPSQATFAVLPKVLEGTRVEDLGLIVASLDASAPEADR